MSLASHTSSKDPPATQEIKTRTGRVSLDRDGILREVSDPGSEQVLADAQENVRAYGALTTTRSPLLVDMSRIKSVSREARVYYATDATQFISAVALVVGSPLNRMLGNFFLGFNKPSIPTRLFSSTEDAARWLRELRGQRDRGDEET